MASQLDLSRRQPLLPLGSDFAVRFYDAAKLDRYKDAVLSVLERTGVRFGSPKALDVLAQHGADVDRASGVVRFAPDLVTAALAKAPRTFWLGSRDGTLDLDLASGDTDNTTNGCGTEVVDWNTGVRRPPTKDDLAAITRMVDYLGSVQFWWPNVAAADKGDTHTLHELDAAWNNTAKHLQGMVQGEREARFAVEMATVVAGGAEQLRRRPPMSNLIGTVQPLVNDKDGIEAALVFAEAGIPVCFVTMPTYGTTAPATKAGAYVMGFAELVSATVCVQLAHPGLLLVGQARGHRPRRYEDHRQMTEAQRPNQEAGDDLVADAEQQRALEHAVAQTHGRGHRDSVAAEQRELHRELALRDAIAHRGHAAGHLSGRTLLAR